jgi:N-acetylglucosaminyl-diphospho-decaprenol L-rhamnosyltransferase
MSPDHTSVLVVTVSYKTAELVERSLRALSAERLRYPATEIRAFVVDNASGDYPKLCAAVAREGWQDWVTVHAAARNGGFSYGNNLGLKHAFEQPSPPEFVMMLNPDAEVRPGCIEALVRFLRAHPRAAVAGSQLVAEDGKPWPYAFRFLSIFSEIDKGVSWGPISRLLGRWSTTRQMGTQPERVDWLPGAAMMVRRSVIELVGGMDERYFLYFEELDFLLKLHRAGLETWYVPDSHVFHVTGASTGVTSAGSRAALPDYWFESRRRFYAKNHGIRYAMLTDVTTLVAHVLGGVKRTVQGTRREERPGFVRGLLRNTVLKPSNREVLEPIEFWPSERGESTNPRRH